MEDKFNPVLFQFFGPFFLGFWVDGISRCSKGVDKLFLGLNGLKTRFLGGKPMPRFSNHHNGD
jgi:hypothetical protein